MKTIGPEYLKNRNVITKNPISNPVDINKNPIIDISQFEENRLYRPMAGKVYKMIPIETIRGVHLHVSFVTRQIKWLFIKGWE